MAAGNTGPCVFCLTEWNRAILFSGVKQVLLTTAMDDKSIKTRDLSDLLTAKSIKLEVLLFFSGPLVTGAHPLSGE